MAYKGELWWLLPCFLLWENAFRLAYYDKLNVDLTRVPLYGFRCLSISFIDVVRRDVSGIGHTICVSSRNTDQLYEMPAKLKLESIDKDGTLLDHATLWAAEDIMGNGLNLSFKHFFWK